MHGKIGTERKLTKKKYRFDPKIEVQKGRKWSCFVLRYKFLVISASATAASLSFTKLESWFGFILV